MDVRQSLLSLSNYPIPMPMVESVAQAYVLDLDLEATAAVRSQADYKRAQAAIYSFLSTAPNVSQGGISFSLSDADKARFRRKALDLLEETGDIGLGGIPYGYKGENL